jgi:ABC-2 type transport system permease protein
MTETHRTVTDLQILIVRALRLSLRNVDGLITALMLPPMLMFMFVYFFGGAIRTGGPYIEFVVPGVLLVCVGFGAGTTAVSVAHDLSGRARSSTGCARWTSAASR